MRRIALAVKLLLPAFALNVVSSLATSAPVAPSRDAGPDLKPALIAERNALIPGERAWVALRLIVPDGWHVYWRNPGDSGQPVRTEWSLPAGYTVDEIQWPVAERLKTGHIVNFGYGGTVVLAQSLSVPTTATGTAVLSAKAKWLACRETCIPGQADLELTLPVSASALPGDGAGDIAAALSRLPKAPDGKASLRPTGDGFELSLPAPAKSATWDFHPWNKREIDLAAPVRSRLEGDRLVLTLTRSPLLEERLERLEGVLTDGTSAWRVVAPLAPAASAADWKSVLDAVWLAFLGGLLLNLMPCVFPVLSIKALSFLESARQDRSHTVAHGLWYSAGVLTSFWTLAGVLFSLRAAGQQLGWGFQLQSPLVGAGIAILLFLMALSLLGVFEINGRWVSMGSGLASRSGHSGAFFTGVLATVVATPCTAPFMGAALGFALTAPIASGFLVFTSLAVGMALPYAALAAWPGLGRMLPRPGRWMESLKQAMAFPLLATVVWLAWVVALQGGVPSVIALLVALLGVGMAAWIFGRWHGRLAGITAVGIALAAIVAGLAPSLPVDPRNELAWQPFSRQRVAELRREGKPVFVDFTAAWCVSCQVNEKVALSSGEVARRFRELGVTPLKADWTNADPEITQALAEFGRSGVPLYVLYPGGNAEPRVLPAILTSSLVMRELDQVRAATNEPAGGR